MKRNTYFKGGFMKKNIQLFPVNRKNCWSETSFKIIYPTPAVSTSSWAKGASENLIPSNKAIWFPHVAPPVYWVESKLIPLYTDDTEDVKQQPKVTLILVPKKYTVAFSQKPKAHVLRRKPLK